jgi:hypothetical protein
MCPCHSFSNPKPGPTSPNRRLMLILVTSTRSWLFSRDSIMFTWRWEAANYLRCSEMSKRPQLSVKCPDDWVPASVLITLGTRPKGTSCGAEINASFLIGLCPESQVREFFCSESRGLSGRKHFSWFCPNTHAISRRYLSIAIRVMWIWETLQPDVKYILTWSWRSL